MSIKIVLAGAAGRVGRSIVAAAVDDSEIELVGALEAAGCSAIGRDAGLVAGVAEVGVAVAETPPAEFDVLVEFSLPAGTVACLDICRKMNKPIVIGTTGHSEAQLGSLREAANAIPIVKAPNMSVGVNVLLRLARQLGAVLDNDYDVEITEAHHRFKRDAPSGTALALRDAVAKGRRSCGGGEPGIVYGRHGETGDRPRGQIGVHSLRLGDTVGIHAVSFGTLGETITIGHEAHSRDTFAHGALRAAKWIVGKPPGLYDMQDVLFGGDASE